MPITLLDNRITVNYSGDPTGDSWVNPMTLDDIVAASDAGGWNPAVTKQGIQYYIPYSLYIIGPDTHFLAEDAQVYLAYVAQTDAYRLYVTTAFRSQGDVHGMSWYMEYNYSHTNFYFNGDDIIIENSRFSKGRSVTFIGDVSNNLLLRNCVLEGCDLINFGGNAYVDIENVVIINGGSNGIWGAYNPANAENIQIIDSSLAFYLFNVSGTWTWRNIKIINTTYHVKYRPGGTTKYVYFIDSELDFTKRTYYAALSAAGLIEAHNVSTFKINIENGDGGTCKLYDAYGDLVFSETLSGEFEKEVTFEKTIATKIADIAGVTYDDYTYHPFRMVVSKPGYADLVINNIYVTAGNITLLFGDIVNPTYADPAPEVELEDEPTTISIIEVETE